MSGIEFDSVAIPRFLARFPEFKDFSTDITAFYRNRAYNYAWFDKDGLGEPAQILLDKLHQESIDGIAINPPYKDTLQNMFHVGDFTERPEHIRPDVNGELMLTGQYLLLAKKIWAGAYSKNLVSIGWNIPRKKISYQELLEKSVDVKNIPAIESEILNPEYLAFREALKQYQELETKSGDPIFFAKLKKSLRPGDTSAMMAQVRQRLNLIWLSGKNRTEFNI